MEEVFADAKAAGGGAARRGGGDDGAAAGAAPRSRRRASGAGEARVPAPSSSGFSYHTVSEVKQGSSVVVTVTVEESA